MSLSFLGGYVLGRQDSAATAIRAAAIPAAGGPGAEDLLDLHDRIDRLILVVGAMAEILEDAGLISEEQLAARVLQLDEADGIVDGKRTPRAARCRECNSAVAPGLTACQFCGTAVAAADTPKPLDGI
jgi:hypothetical protein